MGLFNKKTQPTPPPPARPQATKLQMESLVTAIVNRTRAGERNFDQQIGDEVYSKSAIEQSLRGRFPGGWRGTVKFNDGVATVFSDTFSDEKPPEQTGMATEKAPPPAEKGPPPTPPEDLEAAAAELLERFCKAAAEASSSQGGSTLVSVQHDLIVEIDTMSDLVYAWAQTEKAPSSLHGHKIILARENLATFRVRIGELTARPVAAPTVESLTQVDGHVTDAGEESASTKRPAKKPYVYYDVGTTAALRTTITRSLRRCEIGEEEVAFTVDPSFIEGVTLTPERLSTVLDSCLVASGRQPGPEWGASIDGTKVTVKRGLVTG